MVQKLQYPEKFFVLPHGTYVHASDYDKLQAKLRQRSRAGNIMAKLLRALVKVIPPIPGLMKFREDIAVSVENWEDTKK